MNSIKLKLGGPKGHNKLTLNGVWDFYIEPTWEYPISQIPKGVNPRGLDLDSSKLKDSKETFLKNDGKSLLSNGGMQVCYDTDSLSFEEDEGGAEYVVFDCTDKDSGHYDGQHSQKGIDDAANELLERGETVNNVIKITLSDVGATNQLEKREMAGNWNSRTPQKDCSEMDIMGDFDTLKKSITYTSIENIRWCQNQRNANGDMIPDASNEISVNQLVILMSAFFPLTYDPLVSREFVAKLPKQGHKNALKKVWKGTPSVYLDKLLPYTDFVLEMNDFIQANMVEALGRHFESTAVIRKSSKKALEKVVGDRKANTEYLFNGTRGEYAVSKDFMPILMGAVVETCFEYEDDEFIQIHTAEEAKAMWLTYGQKVITKLDDNFVVNFKGTFKCRTADLANQPTLWERLAKTFSKAVATSRPNWREKMNIRLAA